ncbi:MAG: GAF domain-containing protein [Candidatus Latescibacteria bacterium]|jgi:signal transduction histidine kinase|nr:GAF domain-containing protein [Candidatus Latescibacterota bacterium]
MMNDATKAQRLQEELTRAVSQRDLYIKELHRTTQRFEEKVRELSVVRRIGETLKYTRDPRKVFEVIIDTIIDETSAENCSLMLLNRETNELHTRAARGQEDTEISFYHISSGTRSFKLGEGIAGWVAQYGEPIAIPDINDGEVVRLFPELDASGKPVVIPELPEVPQFVSGPARSIGSMLCLPLVIDNEVVGVVNMSHPLQEAFSSEDSQLMTIITDQVAIALNNVQIFDDLQQQSAFLEDEVSRATEELQSTNDELTSAYDEIQKASQMKSQFLAHMSHELRTPLNAVIGFSEILEDKTFGDLNEKQSRYVHNILTSSRHLLELINEILDLAKVESGEMQLVVTEFLVEDCLGQVTEVVRPLAANKSITLNHDIDPELGLISGDEGRIKQILYNLLSNAIKFTPEDGQVDVLAGRRDDNTLEIVVVDTGIGIKKEHQDLIFSEFRQVEETYSRRYEGTGLGLALTRRLVELHEGKIKVESEVGVGSTFTFTIPQ